jgi:hypothetical protein
MWQGGIRHVFDNNGFIRNSTNGFNAVPNFSFDVTLRFKVGSIWTLDDGTNYICTDNTEGAAVWELYNVIPTNTSDLTNDGSDGINPFITAADIPPITGFVPYTGATSNVDLGTHTLSAKDLVINHSSGSGVAASITKGGAGEALTINKTSGSGNAMSVTGGVTQLSELHLTTDLADSYIASAVTWNGKFTLPALTSGSVLFSNGTTIAQKNASFFWDNTNNRLGIGTATPTEILEVSSTATTGLAITRNALANASRLFFKTTGAYNWSIGLRSTRNDFSIFNETSIEALTINSTTNNVLIGTTTDGGFKLDVNGTARVSGNATFGTLGTGTGMFWDNTNNRLGIGTNAPYSRFTIYGALSTSTSQISIVNSEGGHSIIRSGIAGVNNTGISLITASLDGSSQVTRMVINASGNVLINTTTDVASSKLTIQSTTQGFLPPRMTTTEKNAIATPAAGLVVYDTTLNKLCVRTAAAWETITSI